MSINKLVKELKKICLESENITPMVTLWGLPPTYHPHPYPLPSREREITVSPPQSEGKDKRTPLSPSPLSGEGRGEGVPSSPSPLRGEGGGEGVPSSPSPLRGEGGGEGELNKLAGEVKVCQKCHLGKTRIQAVFGVGNPSARIIFIGEGPGYEEDRRGEPFVGKAGKLLDKILASINLSRRPSPHPPLSPGGTGGEALSCFSRGEGEGIYIANVVKCHPMVNPKQPDLRGNDRPPTQAEAMSCFPYLLRQIEIINPQIICPLGNAAAKVILGTSQGISSIRGKFFEFYHPQLGRNIQVLPTYHPAALLRNPNLKKEVWEDMKLLKRQLQSSLSSLSSLSF